MPPETYDYADRRRRHGDPSLSIVVIEAGSDVSNRADVLEGLPQKQLGGRSIANAAGKVLRGSTAINAGALTRGDKQNYDHWVNVAKDSRWSYDGLLPYFRKFETFHDSHGDANSHRFDGPIKEITPHERRRTPGVAEMIEDRLDGQRIVAPFIYPLDGVDVVTNTLVKRVIIKDISSKKVATAVELADNETGIAADREFIVSTGAYRSPQVLMLSGLGPKDELDKHAIDVYGAPDVGLHLHDHLRVLQWWKLKNPEKGLDWSVPKQGLLDALAADGNLDNAAVASQRSHPEKWIMSMYYPAGTLSMGEVVDTDMRVKGVEGLHVVDASVIPVPLAGHLQNCIYAMAEQAADIILNH
ncbi:Choline dehydrogenase [Talaromyces islandicus]|uniref:glucose oxidase n=1 Tax=Talaromyces islandicus TaxID=28573 RepID=A0A0U1M5S9_TALIS|nr:Choline dehydrogenase [Talaromyces islandicus]